MIDAQEPGFARIRRGAEQPQGSSRAIMAGAYEIALFNVAGEFYALENSCPHQGGPIADGWLEGTSITCPWHGWCFDVRSGKMALGDFARVRRFAVQRDGADLLVALAPMEDEE